MASAIWTTGASRQVYSTSWWCAAIALMTLGDRLWRCAIEAPPLAQVEDRLVACHLYG
jgi:hypothetical protein